MKEYVKELRKLVGTRPILHHKPVTKIYHFETGDLTIDFQNQYYFDLFADSSVFERYQ